MAKLVFLYPVVHYTSEMLSLIWPHFRVNFCPTFLIEIHLDELVLYTSYRSLLTICVSIIQRLHIFLTGGQRQGTIEEISTAKSRIAIAYGHTTF